MSGALDPEALRKDFAKQLAATAFAGRQRHQRRPPPDDAASRARWARAMRSARLAAATGHNNVYGVAIEQAHGRTTAIRQATKLNRYNFLRAPSTPYLLPYPIVSSRIVRTSTIDRIPLIV